MWRWRKSLILTLFGFFLCLSAQAQGLTPLTVKTATGAHQILVELADTPARHRSGLMWRQQMLLNQGMLFVYPNEQPLSFWMKNTPLSLDIIYFDGRGHYINHHAATTPNSLTSLKSTRPAQYVLEINAGQAAMLAITSGSHLVLEGVLGE